MNKYVRENFSCKSFNKLITCACVEASKAEVDKIQAQLDHTKQYCKWLENLSNAIESGQIFEHYPIPEKEDI